MKNLALCLSSSFILASQCFGCSLFSSQDVGINYDVEPQELAQDLGPPQMGMFPEVDCTASDTLCTTVPSPITGATVTCDAAATSGTKHCVAHYDLTVHQTLDLSKQ